MPGVHFSPRRRPGAVGILGLVAAVALACALWIAAPAHAVAIGAQHFTPALQPAVALQQDKQVRVRPALGTKRRGSLPAYGLYSARQTVVPVLARHDGWLKVPLQTRPNGVTGWITEDGTTPVNLQWHVVVSTSRRKAYIYRNGKLVRHVPVVVGKPSTPTPHGEFYITDIVPQHGGALGPDILVTNAFSSVLQEFDGGPGQVGLHGTGTLGASPGQAASHGCIRFADRVIAWLASHVRQGTPVTLHR